MGYVHEASTPTTERREKEKQVHIELESSQV